MLTIRKQPSEKYLKGGTFCLSPSEFAIVHNPNIMAEIVVFTQDGEVHATISKSQFPLLIFTSKTSYDGGNYYITDFNRALPNYTAPVKLPTTFMTQEDIAKHYEIWQCRVCIFEDCGWLKADHTVKKTRMYRAEDVLALRSNATFNTWLANQYERVGRRVSA